VRDVRESLLEGRAVGVPRRERHELRKVVELRFLTRFCFPFTQLKKKEPRKLIDLFCGAGGLISASGKARVNKLSIAYCRFEIAPPRQLWPGREPRERERLARPPPQAVLTLDSCGEA
jgi:hypothetical protein